MRRKDITPAGLGSGNVPAGRTSPPRLGRTSSDNAPQRSEANEESTMTPNQSTHSSLKDFLTRAVLLAVLPWVFVLALVVEIRRRFTEVN